MRIRWRWAHGPKQGACHHRGPAHGPPLSLLPLPLPLLHFLLLARPSLQALRPLLGPPNLAAPDLARNWRAVLEPSAPAGPEEKDRRKREGRTEERGRDKDRERGQDRGHRQGQRQREKRYIKEGERDTGEQKNAGEIKLLYYFYDVPQLVKCLVCRNRCQQPWDRDPSLTSEKSPLSAASIAFWTM